jgi:signal transduction histidine kinase
MEPDVKTARPIRCEVDEDLLITADRLIQLGRFVPTFIHDLNNCLMVISGVAELAAEDPGVAPEQVARFNRIGSQATRGSRVIQDLAAFARSRSRTVEPTDLGEVVDGVIALRQDALARLGVQIRVDREQGGNFDVMGSYRELEQLVMALALNAEDALAFAPVPRQLRLTFQTDDRTVSLEVSDSGSGVPEAVQASLFEPFTTGHPADHAGLGLAAARLIVERHHGHITTEPVPSGTTVVVRLPRA